MEVPFTRFGGPLRLPAVLDRDHLAKNSAPVEDQERRRRAVVDLAGVLVAAPQPPRAVADIAPMLRVMQLAELGDAVEAVSRRYAETHGIERSDTWFLLKLQEEVGELTQAFLMRSGQARTKGMTTQELDARFSDELADVVSHVLLMARHHDIDLEAAVGRKWLVWNRDASVAAESRLVAPGLPVG